MTNKPDENLEISVIIPVYNAGRFVERAVKSALSQSETAEIILIEDASTDNSYDVCRDLFNQHEIIRLYTHEGHVNKGAAESRNVGINNAQYDYIAFLDADDFYLENRFSETKKVLQKQPDADGVYEAIEAHFDNELAEAQWFKNNSRLLTTIEGGIKPDDFFYSQSPVGSKGCTHLDGLTVRKSALLEVGMFDPGLRLHQDRALYLRLAMAASLYPGQVEKPVAKRGVHGDNRITKIRSLEESIVNFKKMLHSTCQWAKRKGYNEEAGELKKILKYSRIYKASGKYYNGSLRNLNQYVITSKETPSVLFEVTFYKCLFKFLLRYIWIKTLKIKTITGKQRLRN